MKASVKRPLAKFEKKVDAHLRRMWINTIDRMPMKEHDLSWKIRWRMKNDRNPKFVLVQDKYKVKEYAHHRGVLSADTYFVTEEPDTIPFETLPANYFLKANHGCKWNIMCKNGEFYLFDDGEDLIGRKNFDDNRLTRDEVLKYCETWLNTIYSRREWAYSQIPPRIMAEEVLEQRGGGDLIDYRFFTFHGKVKAIYVDSATYSIYHQKIFFDTNWKEFKINNLKESFPHPELPKPEKFELMIESAEKLAEDLDFVRVDLYDTKKGIVLGEMSIYPMGGEEMQPSPDSQFNKWLGDQWRLPG